MSTQQQPRPWFRFAPVMRPAPAPAPPPPLARPPAPTPSRQAPPPVSPFRPPLAQPRPLPPAAASPPQTFPIATSASVTPTTPRSPQITSAGASPPPPQPPPAPSPSPKSPKSPAPPPPPPVAASITRSPTATPVPPPKPGSPIIKNASSSPPASPIIKTASAETSSAARPVVSSPSLSASPKTKLASPPSSTIKLPASPAPKTLPYSYLPSAAAAPPVPPPPSPVAATAARPRAAPSPMVKQPSWEKSTTPPPDQAQSTIVKPLSHPPSPLTLPPPKLKADATSHDYDLEPIPPEAVQKTVLTHHDTNHEKAPKINVSTSGERERQVKKDKGSTATHKDKKNHNKSDVSSPEFGMRVVTLAGDNKGAVMELSPGASRKKYGSGQHFWSNGGQKLGSGEKEEEGHDDDGGIKKGKDENGMSKLMTAPQAPTDAFVNSNVQGVNNSIVYNCTYSNRDPGVHLSVSRKGNGGRHHQQQDSGHYNVHRD